MAFAPRGGSRPIRRELMDQRMPGARMPFARGTGGPAAPLFPTFNEGPRGTGRFPPNRSFRGSLMDQRPRGFLPRSPPVRDFTPRGPFPRGPPTSKGFVNEAGRKSQVIIKEEPKEPKPGNDLNSQENLATPAASSIKIEQEEKVERQLNNDERINDVKEEEGQNNVILDGYNCDLHFNIDDSGFVGWTLHKDGFEYLWGGCRGTHGVCTGKVAYECTILENLAVSVPETERNPHVLRVGWSIDGSDLQLGEDSLSYGYGGTGKSSINSKFSDYGRPFGVGDVITCCLDLDARPKAVFYLLNGEYMGIASKIGPELGNQVLFPHITVKNVKFEVNFGRQWPKFPIPPGFSMLQNVSRSSLIRAPEGPKRPQDAEIMMMVGLPACGKTVWAEKFCKEHPEKKYYMLGTNSIIDKMRIMGLTRKRNYHGRWDALIKQASACLNIWLKIAAKRVRNYILDQTNVYFTARRRKMKSFGGYKRKACVIVNDLKVLQERTEKTQKEEGKIVPVEAIMEMKANFSLPEVGESFDEVIFIEEQLPKAAELVQMYQSEGNTFKSGSRFHSSNNQEPRAKMARTEPQGMHRSAPRPVSYHGRESGSNFNERRPRDWDKMPRHDARDESNRYDGRRPYEQVEPVRSIKQEPFDDSYDRYQMYSSQGNTVHDYQHIDRNSNADWNRDRQPSIRYNAEVKEEKNYQSTQYGRSAADNQISLTHERGYSNFSGYNDSKPPIYNDAPRGNNSSQGNYGGSQYGSNASSQYDSSQYGQGYSTTGSGRASDAYSQERSYQSPMKGMQQGTSGQSYSNSQYGALTSTQSTSQYGMQSSDYGRQHSSIDNQQSSGYYTSRQSSTGQQYLSGQQNTGRQGYPGQQEYMGQQGYTAQPQYTGQQGYAGQVQPTGKQGYAAQQQYSGQQGYARYQ